MNVLPARGHVRDAMANGGYPGDYRVRNDTDK